MPPLTLTLPLIEAVATDRGGARTPTGATGVAGVATAAILRPGSAREQGTDLDRARIAGRDRAPEEAALIGRGAGAAAVDRRAAGIGDLGLGQPAVVEQQPEVGVDRGCFGPTQIARSAEGTAAANGVAGIADQVAARPDSTSKLESFSQSGCSRF